MACGSCSRPARAGWAGEATLDEVGRVILAIQILDRGMLVTLEAPSAQLAAARAELIDVLGRGTMEWEAPADYTIAELLAGITR